NTNSDKQHADKRKMRHAVSVLAASTAVATAFNLNLGFTPNRARVVTTSHNHATAAAGRTMRARRSGPRLSPCFSNSVCGSSSSSGTFAGGRRSARGAPRSSRSGPFMYGSNPALRDSRAGAAGAG
ncbi:unnamed protein product, partial [Ectocarpus sp. 12 AP-2014]